MRITVACMLEKTRVSPLWEKVLRVQDKGIGKEWGVKSIKSKQDDGHGTIEFLRNFW